MPLRAERNLIERYLLLEEIRLGERLALEWEWPTWADDLELPPLLLQPWWRTPSSTASPPARRAGPSASPSSGTETAWSCPSPTPAFPLPEERHEGTGLGNLRQRLTLLPSLKPALELVQDGERTVARLTLG